MISQFTVLILKQVIQNYHHIVNQIYRDAIQDLESILFFFCKRPRKFIDDWNSSESFDFQNISHNYLKENAISFLL